MTTESQTRSEIQAKAKRMANGLMRHVSFQQNFGHRLCHDPQCKVCEAGAIIVSECLNLPALLTAKAERDELRDSRNDLQCKFDSICAIVDQLRADLAKASAKLSERKTVHEWLNLKSIPTTEFGKPICLLRRLRIALDNWQIEPLNEIEKLRTDLATAKAENVALRDVSRAAKVIIRFDDLSKNQADTCFLKNESRGRAYCEVSHGEASDLFDALRTIAEKGVVL